MKVTKKSKSGFTLVELMVVAIIVAILAAVAIPLMSGNRDRAAATEAQAGCTTVASSLKVYWAEYGSAYAATMSMAEIYAQLKSLETGDLNGTYFSSYAVSGWTAKDAYTITATGNGTKPVGSSTVTMTVTGGKAVWTGFGQ